MEEVRNSVLIVDDDIVNLRALVEILSEEYTVYAERDGKRCLEATARIKPDLILMDVLMPDMGGFELIKALKSDDKTKDIPVIFVTGLTNADDETEGFNLGAVDYIVKPYSEHVVRRRVSHQMRIINLLYEVSCLSLTDSLTGLGNRRYFSDLLLHEWARARRQQEPLSFLILNIDDFKKFNDAHGYSNGDVALQCVANIINQKTTRATDRVARWGGEEFAVILPDTVLSGALKIAEDIRATVENADIKLDDGSSEKVTISIGVHSYIPERVENYSEAMFVSDTGKALSSAKKSGKNCVCAANA